MATQFEQIRPDHQAILEWIEPKTSILDLGCGNGELLNFLVDKKDCCGYGVEIRVDEIYKCVERGINILHGNIESSLSDYKDLSFDYVILNQSLQQVRLVDKVLEDALRVGRKVIVGFPNFAYYQSRLQVLFAGKTPVNASLPYQWYTTPNLHFLSISDFVEYCRDKKITIEQKVFIGKEKKIYFFPNFFSQTGLFLISK